MKIERVRSFTPVVITLETEEELKALVLNLGSTKRSDIVDTYLSVFGSASCEAAYTLGYDMWKKFNSILSEIK